jgi:hypothetical protein
MRKKLIVSILLLGLVAALSAPAVAGKKKVKPWKSETVTINVGHTALYSTSGGTFVGVTAQEFLQSCAIPSSNGVDSYVFEVPKAYQKLAATALATGTTANPEGYDLDLYFYDKGCQNVGVFNAAGTDEYGAMTKGTAFILLHNYAGTPVDAQVTLKPAK